MAAGKSATYKYRVLIRVPEPDPANEGDELLDRLRDIGVFEERNGDLAIRAALEEAAENAEDAWMIEAPYAVAVPLTRWTERAITVKHKPQIVLEELAPPPEANDGPE